MPNEIKCSTCDGSGKDVTDPLLNEVCPDCQGSGKIVSKGDQ